MPDKITLEEIEDNHLYNLTNGKQGKRLVKRGADLTDADLTGADLTGADLTGADLTGADLTYADLTYADLTGACLRGACLRGADLTGACLRGADLTGACLRGARGAFVVHGDLYIWIVVQHEARIMLQAGCHWFTISEAREYWNGDMHHSRICRGSIDAAVAMAKARGWKINEEK